MRNATSLVNIFFHVATIPSELAARRTPATTRDAGCQTDPEELSSAPSENAGTQTEPGLISTSTQTSDGSGVANVQPAEAEPINLSAPTPVDGRDVAKIATTLDSVKTLLSLLNANFVVTNGNIIALGENNTKILEKVEEVADLVEKIAENGDE